MSLKLASLVTLQQLLIFTIESKLHLMPTVLTLGPTTQQWVQAKAITLSTPTLLGVVVVPVMVKKLEQLNLLKPMLSLEKFWLALNTN